jgi:hypothetical protein
LTRSARAADAHARALDRTTRANARTRERTPTASAGMRAEEDLRAFTREDLVYKAKLAEQAERCARRRDDDATRRRRG